MLIIHGLGNPGKKYSENKHNLGWMIIDELCLQLGLSMQNINGGFFTKFNSNFLFKSSGFMNNSGQDLLKFVSYLKLSCEDIHFLVIQDDSDQFIGRAKLVLGGGSAGHRGISDIYKFAPNLSLDFNNIWRLKIGIRPIENKLKSETFVLSNIDQQEKNVLKEISNLLKVFLQENKMPNQSGFINLQQVINSKFGPK